MVLEWLPRQYPARFRLHRAAGGGAVQRVQTLSPGYQHTFLVADFVHSPQTLMGVPPFPPLPARFH